MPRPITKFTSSLPSRVSFRDSATKRFTRSIWTTKNSPIQYTLIPVPIRLVLHPYSPVAFPAESASGTLRRSDSPDRVMTTKHSQAGQADTCTDRPRVTPIFTSCLLRRVSIRDSAVSKYEKELMCLILRCLLM